MRERVCANVSVWLCGMYVCDCMCKRRSAAFAFALEVSSTINRVIIDIYISYLDIYISYLPVRAQPPPPVQFELWSFVFLLRYPSLPPAGPPPSTQRSPS